MSKTHKYQKFGTLYAQVGESIHKTGWYFQSKLGQFFKEHGLTPQQYNIVRVLNRPGAEDGIPSLEIAGLMIERLPDITRLVDRIEKLGLATRRRSTKDRRVVYVMATEKARNLFQKLEQPLLDFAEDLLGHLSEDELSQLLTLLAKARKDEEEQ